MAMGAEECFLQAKQTDAVTLKEIQTGKRKFITFEVAAVENCLYLKTSFYSDSQTSNSTQCC